MNSSKQILGVYLKNKRFNANLSQSEVAKRLGHKTPQFISNWERGLCHPPIKDIKTLAQLFQISAEDLFENILESYLDQIREECRREFFNSKKIKRISSGDN